MNIKTKILTPVILITLIVAAAILVSNIVLFSGSVEESSAATVNTALKIAVQHLEDLKMKAAAAALSMAENHEFAEALANNDRGELLERAREVQDVTGVEFCTITNPEGIVVGRTHDPETYGDSVAFRATVRAGMAGEALTAMEEGSGVLLAIRSAMPVFAEDGKILGVATVGYRLDTETFVDAVKEISGCEATVILNGIRISTTVRLADGSRAQGTKSPEEITAMIMAGIPYTGRANIQGRAAVSSYSPFHGPDGQVLGALYTGQYLDETAKITRAFIQSGLVITLIILAVFIGVILYIVSRIVAPVHSMTRAAIALAAGDTEIDVRVKTHDEMYILAQAFGSMVENTKEQVEIIGHIAAGNLEVSPRERSEKDVMNRALGKLNETIRAQAAAIREEYERIKLMLDANPLASRLWNRNFDLIACNEAAVKLFGLTNKQEYMARYFELAPEYQPDGEKTSHKVRRSVTEAFEKGICVFEWMYCLLDGTPVPAENTMVRVPYGDDFVVAAYSRDLREQKKMLADIERRDYLLQTVNQAADILLRSEPDDFSATLQMCMRMMAQAVDADRMYLHKNHWENGTLYNTKLYEWVENPGQFHAEEGVRFSCGGKPLLVQDTLCRGESVHSMVRDLPPACRDCLGARNALSVMVIPVFIRNEFWGFVGFDNRHSEALFSANEESIVRSGSLLIVNALLRNESLFRIRDTSAKLETALTDAKEANNAKTNFLAHMSHEIRTPLNAVIGFSELTLDEEDLNPEAKSNLEKIVNAGSTILSIVNDILDISKIESGKFEIYPVQYDTPSLINDTAMLNVVRIGEKIITFKLYVDENLPGKLFGDDLRVKQIFNNLLSNAFKYTQSGTVEWRVSFERDGNIVWLVSSVRDTGAGIKPEDIKKLFGEYSQVDGKINRRIEGTGLGLAITKRLVEMMDGTIAVESEYGKGTAFHVRLRQTLVSGAPIGEEVAGNLMGMRYSISRRAGKTRQGRVNLSYAHVLVVDDVQTNLDVAKGMMKPYKIKIDCAISGQEAVDMIRAGEPRYDAVFMDHMMPGMDGIEAVRIIREEIGTDYARNIPVIALTANAIVGNNEMFLSRGFQDFVSKPIDMMKLDLVLRTWVRNKELEKELLSAGEETVPGDDRDPNAGGEKLSLENISIDGMDKDKALEGFGGDEEILVDVMRSYAASTRPFLTNLREYLAAENLKDYAILVHGIKGASYGIFAQETGNAARVLELAAKAGNLDEVKAGHDAFEKMAETLLDNIDKALGKIDGE